MIRNRLQPILWIFRVLKKDTFRVQMSKSALLKTLFWNIFNRELKTREESSRIRQTFADLSKPILEMKHSKTPDMERPLSIPSFQFFSFNSHFLSRHVKVRATSTMNQSDIRGLAGWSDQSQH